MNSTPTAIQRTGIEIIEVATDMTLPELAQHLKDAGLQPYQSRSSGSKINGRPIHRGDARPGLRHMSLFPYYIIGDPHCLSEAKTRGGSFIFFGFGDQIARNDIIPAGTLILVSPALQAEVTEIEEE